MVHYEKICGDVSNQIICLILLFRYSERGSVQFAQKKTEASETSGFCGIEQVSFTFCKITECHRCKVVHRASIAVTVERTGNHIHDRISR